MSHSNKGDFAYSDSGDTLVEFFSKAGSLFKGKKSYYGNEATALQLFRPAWMTDNYTAMQLAMWLRDVRGGSGNRSGFRDILAWLGKEFPAWVKSNIHLIPEVGRWDDLESLDGTSCEQVAYELWAKAIMDKNGLANKWAPREKNNKPIFHKLRKLVKMSPKDFRKHLSTYTKVVESKMCQDKWYEIDYNKEVPSVAMARYNNAFVKHDTVRFNQWKESLSKPDTENKVKATVLYPHDVVRTLLSDANLVNGNSLMANAQFDALPDYIGGTDQRIMAICDFSGSMEGTAVSGSATAMDASLGLGLYCSDRLGKDNPFYRRFIPFSETSCLADWRNETFSISANKYRNGYCGGTNIRAALDRILDAAKLFNATKDQIPNTLLIISDMQFDQGTGGEEMTSVEAGIKAWEDAGYNRPKILYWNMAGYATTPGTVHHKDIGLVSGFSPSILKAVLSGDDFSPMAIMMRTIEKYAIVRPE